MIAKKTLRAFYAVRANAEGPMDAWYRGAVRAEWTCFADVKNTFPSADQVGEKLVFNVGGNNFRIACSIVYPGQVMFIKWVGTHAEYDKVDANDL